MIKNGVCLKGLRNQNAPFLMKCAPKNAATP